MLIKKFPNLRLTLDLSHWNVVCERLVPLDFLEPCWDRVDHIHARVGTHEFPQLSNPTEDKQFLYYHEDAWKKVWKAQEKNRAVSTLTPEYGPSEDYYMPYQLIMLNNIQVKKPLEDVNQIILLEAKRLAAQYESFFG